MDVNARPSEPADQGTASYEELVSAALDATFQGWNFSWLQDRTSGEELPWRYDELAHTAIRESQSLLDVDTGGGEQLHGLQPLPAKTVATEGWPPNVELARLRLEPLGVEVRRAGGDQLPVGDGEFDLVLNRHGAFDPDELWRALRPGGMLLTQQVGSHNDLELNAAMGAAPSVNPNSHTCDTAVSALKDRGFHILNASETMVPFMYNDIAAVIYQLRAVSWTIPDFDVELYDRQLRALHARICAEGSLVVRNHRFLIRATKPGR